MNTSSNNITQILSIGKIAAKKLFSELRSQGPLYCHAIKKDVEITKLFFKHVVEHKKNKRTEEDFLERFFIICHINDILEKGECTEERNTNNEIYKKISYQVDMHVFSIVLVKHLKKDCYLLLSCFHDEKLTQQKRDLLSPSMEHYGQSRTSLASIIPRKDKHVNNILLIGAGKMGGAIGLSLLENKFIFPHNLYISDKNTDNLSKFPDCKTSQNAEDFIPSADIIILATKPQILRDLLDSWKDDFKKDVLLLSIAAGVNIADLQKYSHQSKIIRIMPNTPLLVNKGVSGFFASEFVSREEKEYTQKMLECFGVAIECRTEDQIDAITGLSGSGPAYFFRILEIHAQKAIEMGFAENQANKIAINTLLGAGLLAKQSDESFTTLRENVTSKGGTTAAALESFEQNDLETLWETGIEAAYKRAKEL